MVVGAIGLFVWRSNSTEIAAPVSVSTPTVKARPPAPQPQPTADATSVASTTPAVSPDVDPITITKEEIPDPLDLIATWPSDRPFSLLLLGLDQRPGEATGRTDAMVLTRVEPANKSAALISIPRDLCVADCRTEPYRINSVYQNEGPDVLRQRVGEIMGINVDYLIVLDFYGLSAAH